MMKNKTVDRLELMTRGYEDLKGNDTYKNLSFEVRAYAFGVCRRRGASQQMSKPRIHN